MSRGDANRSLDRGDNHFHRKNVHRARRKQIARERLPFEHVLEKHENCQIQNCHICDGGLAYCTKCKTGEAEMPTDCPGYPITPYYRNDIMNGRVDYIDGRWVP